MKYGLALPNVAVSTIANYARLAEETGWDGFFLGDAIWTVDPMISLTAAAMVTQRIRLGTMVIPMPLRRPWKVASESAALDNLSSGRLILGLGTGATWMGWQGFPDEPADLKTRVGMLDESIDILTQLFLGKQFDFDGKHYHLKLSLVDEMHYPPLPFQKPRIPLWVVGVWPKEKSMRRVLRCDGVLPAKMNPEGKFEDLQPADVVQMKAYIDSNRTLTTPFDIVVEGKTAGFNPSQIRDTIDPWIEAGATWWIEGLWAASHAEIMARIEQGPPRVSEE